MNYSYTLGATVYHQAPSCPLHTPGHIQYIAWAKNKTNKNVGVSWADNSVKVQRNLTISNPKPDLHNINAQWYYQVWWKSIVYSSYQLETKIWASRADNPVNIWWNLIISNPKPDLHNINAHTKFGENPLMFTQVIIRIRNMDRWTDVRLADGPTERHMDVQRETIIPHHYHVAGYKVIRFSGTFSKKYMSVGGFLFLFSGWVHSWTVGFV